MSHAHRARAALAAVLILTLLAPALLAPAIAQTPAPQPAPSAPSAPSADGLSLRGLDQMRQQQAAFVAIADKVAPTVVAIQAQRKLSSLEQFDQEDAPFLRRFGDRLVPAVGSGIIISTDGEILTNEHVVTAAEELVVVMSNRHRYKAVVVGVDVRSDLAVIRVEQPADRPKEKFPAATLADLDTVRQGHWAIAMGNAFGLAADGKPSMTVGIVSAIGRGLPTLGADEDRYYGNLIQTSADINPGNSGGPLLNIDGQVIGINTAISSRSGVSEGVGFAVPITRRTRAILATLRRGEPVEYGFLGVSVRPPTVEESARVGSPAYVGAMVDLVTPDTPAAAARITLGDIIVAVDGETIEDSDHLVRTIGGAPIGQPVKITLWRDKKEQTVPVVLARRSEVLAARKAEPDKFQWRGLSVGPLSEARRKALGLAKDAGGVEVLEVAKDSPAANAEIAAGDVIDRLADRPVRGLADFRRRADRIAPNRPAKLHLQKAGEKTLQPD